MLLQPVISMLRGLVIGIRSRVSVTVVPVAAMGRPGTAALNAWLLCDLLPTPIGEQPHFLSLLSYSTEHRTLFFRKYFRLD